MQENINDYEFCIKLALDNAKKRINLLEDSNKKCVMEEDKMANHETKTFQLPMGIEKADKCMGVGLQANKMSKAP